MGYAHTKAELPICRDLCHFADPQADTEGTTPSEVPPIGICLGAPHGIASVGCCAAEELLPAAVKDDGDKTRQTVGMRFDGMDSALARVEQKLGSQLTHEPDGQSNAVRLKYLQIQGELLNSEIAALSEKVAAQSTFVKQKRYEDLTRAAQIAEGSVAALVPNRSKGSLQERLDAHKAQGDAHRAQGIILAEAKRMERAELRKIGKIADGPEPTQRRQAFRRSTQKAAESAAS